MQTRSDSRPNEHRKFRLADNSDESWREFGRRDPYFGVLSVERFRTENLTEETLAEFFESGETHIAHVLASLHDHVAPDLQNGAALDFGCGVGRLVLPLAARYRHVTGVDISEDYRNEAMNNVRRRGYSNVDFVETVEEARAGRLFDLVHSSIVFNHIPWPQGKHIIGEMLAALRPGGAMAIQVMHKRNAGIGRRIASQARKRFLPINWLANVIQGRPIFEPLMQGNEYSLDKLLPFLQDGGAREFHIKFDKTPEGHVFAFIFCVKVK